MTDLASDRRVLARDVLGPQLQHTALPPEDIVAATTADPPATATLPLADLAGVTIGVWEITPGVVRDTETDEVFVVLSGEGTVRFEDGASVELGPGVAVRLHAGEQTVWEIRSTLRKIYIA